MDLITDSKDERLNDPNQHNTQSGAMQEFLELYRESLMCLLNSQEDHGPNLAGEPCCCNDCLYGTHEELFARCNTALTRAEAAEKKRDELKEAVDWACKYGDFPNQHAGKNPVHSFEAELRRRAPEGK